MAPPGRTSALLPTQPLVLVTGKGGVGRSTVASAIAARLAELGRQVVLAHPVDAPPAHPRPIYPAGVQVRPLDRDAALRRYLDDHLPGPLASALRASRAFRLISAATPGLAELITIGELRHLAEAEASDHVIYDAPATGHLLALLDAPGRFERAAAAGPIARRSQQLGAWILSPAITGIVAVTTGDALATAELLDLVDALERRTGTPPQLIIANRLAVPAPPASELAQLPALSLPDGTADALAQLATRARSERAQLGRITRRAGRPPLQSPEQPQAPVGAVLDALRTLNATPTA
ncbi:MAG: ArsA-related P-loop ATPase [Patulibacter sp.]